MSADLSGRFVGKILSPTTRPVWTTHSVDVDSERKWPVNNTRILRNIGNVKPYTRSLNHASLHRLLCSPTTKCRLRQHCEVDLKLLPTRWNGGEASIWAGGRRDGTKRERMAMTGDRSAVGCEQVGEVRRTDGQSAAATRPPPLYIHRVHRVNSRPVGLWHRKSSITKVRNFSIQDTGASRGLRQKPCTHGVRFACNIPRSFTARSL